MTKIVTIKQQAYKIIKLRIANGTYPRGFHLQELEIAEDLQISRSPVREALKQLAAEELVEEIPNKGVMVRRYSAKEIGDVFDFRILVECAAVDFLAAHPKVSIEKELLHLLKIEENMSNEVDYLMEPEVNVHYPLVNATGNYFLIEAHKKASTITMFHHDILFQEGRYNLTVQSHIAITNALLAHKYEEAKKELVKHLEHSKNVICQALEESNP